MPNYNSLWGARDIGWACRGGWGFGGGGGGACADPGGGGGGGGGAGGLDPIGKAHIIWVDLDLI